MISLRRKNKKVQYIGHGMNFLRRFRQLLFKKLLSPLKGLICKELFLLLFYSLFTKTSYKYTIKKSTSKNIEIFFLRKNFFKLPKKCKKKHEMKNVYFSENELEIPLLANQGVSCIQRAWNNPNQCQKVCPQWTFMHYYRTLRCTPCLLPCIGK